MRALKSASTNNRRWWIWTSTVVLSGIAGCGAGGADGNVRGTLLLHDGSPLVGARVMARADEGAAYGSGLTDVNGHFELVATKTDGTLPPGSYTVTVAEERGDFDNREPATIASKYRNAPTSGLQFTIQPGIDTTFEATLDPP